MTLVVTKDLVLDGTSAIKERKPDIGTHTQLNARSIPIIFTPVNADASNDSARKSSTSRMCTELFPIRLGKRRDFDGHRRRLRPVDLVGDSARSLFSPAARILDSISISGAG